MDELHEVAQRYLSRLDGQLEEEKKQRRPGRLMSKRQQEIEATKEREERQYAKEGLGGSRAHLTYAFENTDFGGVHYSPARPLR